MLEQRIKTHKFIIHQSGLPIRLNPHIRKEVKTKNGELLLNMISSSPTIGIRTPKDTLPENLEENKRLRRIARQAGKELVCHAESFGINQYAVIAHGSLARGLVRHPSCATIPSDIDVDLVINTPGIPKEDRDLIRQTMHDLHSEYGAKIDTYVWDMKQVKRNKGEYARLYLRSSAYPIKDVGNLWEDLVWIGVESQKYLNLEPRFRKKLIETLNLLSQNKTSEAIHQVNLMNVWIQKIIYGYLIEHQLLSDVPESQELAQKLYWLLADDKNKESAQRKPVVVWENPVSTYIVQDETLSIQELRSLKSGIKGQVR